MAFSFPNTTTTLTTTSTTTGFALPSTSTMNLGIGGAGDASKTNQLKPLFGGTSSMFGASVAGAPNLSFGTPGTTAAPSIALGTSIAASSAPKATGFSLIPPSSAAAAPAISLPSFSFGSTTTASSAPNLNFGTLTATTASNIVSTTNITSTSQSSLNFGFSASTSTISTTSVAPTTVNAASSVPTLAISEALSYNQLEDAINKWTIDLEEQEKIFLNQAKQLNAWDRLLISNGDKVMQLNYNIEKVKQQQEQLDQELDFVIAQQKELENCIHPLEKELQDVPIQDIDRKETYQLAENLDSQLKQMSEDLKEVIEHLNESTKSQEMSDPISQISRILNVHMDSLQWIDRNTAVINEQLDQISKMHDYTKHII